MVKGIWNEGKREVGGVILSSSSQESTNVTKKFKHGINIAIINIMIINFFGYLLYINLLLYNLCRIYKIF